LAEDNSDGCEDILYASADALTSVLADSLCAKLTRAKDGVAETQPAFEQLTDCLDPSLIREWTRQEQVAMEQRGDNLTIYDVKSTKCRRIFYFHCGAWFTQSW
jgi:hypothetical protein